jgi:hypothetical protein
MTWNAVITGPPDEGAGAGLPGVATAVVGGAGAGDGAHADNDTITTATPVGRRSGSRTDRRMSVGHRRHKAISVLLEHRLDRSAASG